ncbi:DUF3429 domain-containing protein [Vibrio panuliri]|uniref:DUF3429 domain-containing protein n=1 Tax=Vibrio panuliri TaxID=1381081 RepID=A0ABX3FDU1_9VIBR|nr:DUF3429 domain-containing protein [Vibrio panuliri]KAB1454626.1 DUF3429 domain-containing protein [Vibrio panuliri]OLQ90774.1 hypothetical protein BIY20_10525 [Vibrio panuliri]
MIKKLGYMGLVPFVVLPLMLLTPQYVTPSLTTKLFTMYSVCIASFMAGTLWGREVDKPSAKPYMLMVSNGIVLCALAFALIADFKIIGAIMGLMLTHLINFISERKRGDQRYYHLRKVLTAVVIICHALMILLLSWSITIE